MARLTGKVAIITGAAQGMGAATARVFVQEGAHVVITDVKADAGRALAAELGDTATFIPHDVSDDGNWREVAGQAARQFGGVDILVNNAGIVFMGGSILEIERSDFRRLFDIKVIGTWLGIKHVAPAMMARGGGSIVNIASISALTGLNGIAPYAVSKWGVRGLSKTAAMELGPKNIRVNTIFPGTINTEMGNIARESEEALNARHHGQPIGRVGRPDEVARASLFLASDDSSYMSGAEIVVDGGMTTGFYSSALPNGID